MLRTFVPALIPVAGTFSVIAASSSTELLTSAWHLTGNTLEDPAVSNAARQMGTTLLAINQRHERLIDGLLTLAGSEQALTQRALIDLAAVARHVVTQADAQSVGIQCDLEPAVVCGDPVLLERLAANLVDNAVRYNLPAHGRAVVRTGTAGGDAMLSMEHSGPVIAAYDIPGLFEPFRRLPATDRQAGSGTGWGLSIVRAVAHAHGAQSRRYPATAAASS